MLLLTEVIFDPSVTDQWSCEDSDPSSAQKFIGTIIAKSTISATSANNIKIILLSLKIYLIPIKDK